MPKEIEAKLREQAAKAGKTGRSADRYVYGALNNKGLMHGSKETPKGAKAEKKFERDHGAPKVRKTEVEEHAYDWRQRSGLKRGRD